jgi:hypothetical protein
MLQISAGKQKAVTVQYPFLTGCFYGIKKGEKPLGM